MRWQTLPVPAQHLIFSLLQICLFAASLPYNQLGAKMPGWSCSANRSRSTTMPQYPSSTPVVSFAGDSREGPPPDQSNLHPNSCNSPTQACSQWNYLPGGSLPVKWNCPGNDDGSNFSASLSRISNFWPNRRGVSLTSIYRYSAVY